MNRITRLATMVALTALLAVGGATAASAQGSATLTANPSSVAVNETTAITATGLGGLERASFGFGQSSDGAQLSADKDGTGSRSASVAASNGQATVYFRSSQAGTYTVVVGDGENVLGTLQVTVDQASPTQPTSAPSNAIIEVGDTRVVGQKVRVEGKVSGLENVTFGLDSTDAGSFSDGTATGSSITTRVNDGVAVVEFTPARAGSVTIALSDGETVLASAVVTVSAASPSPTASPTPSATPSAAPAPAPTSQSTPVLPWVLLILAVLVIAGLIVWLVLSRRRASRTGTGTGTGTGGTTGV